MNTIEAQLTNGRKDGLVFGTLLLAALAVYFTALSHYFIDDDFIHLDFIRNFHGNYLEFLLPNLRPSDPVTHTRYEPFHIGFYALLYKALGVSFHAYQLLNIVLHSLNAFLLYRIGKKINISGTGSLLGAVFFCVYRLNSQNVLWYASLFCTAEYSLVLAAFLLFLTDSRRGHFFSVVLFLAASLLSVRAPQFVLAAGAYLAVFRKGLDQKGTLERKLRTFRSCVGVTAFSVTGNLISRYYFPGPVHGSGADLSGLPAFFLNLTFPYDFPLQVKAAALLVFCAVLFARRTEKTVSFLTLAVVFNAVFWFAVLCVTHLPYTPRYYYLGAAFFSLLAGHLLGSALVSGPRRKRLVSGALAACLILGNVFLLVSEDIVWFRYLSVRGQKLEALALSREGTEKIKVFVPDVSPDDPNLNYFRDRLEFVSDPGDGPGVIRVDLERGKYEKYFGRDFGARYWFHPWFLNTGCAKNMTWC